MRKNLILLAIASAALGACAQPKPATSPHALQLSAVAISVPALEPAMAWYRDALGLELGRQLDFPDLGLRMAWLHSRDVEVELVETRGSQPRARLLPDASNPALVQGFGKVGFVVADVDGWEARLRARAVTFQVDIRDDQATQSRTFVVLDNNGNWLQFSKPYAPAP